MNNKIAKILSSMLVFLSVSTNPLYTNNSGIYIPKSTFVTLDEKGNVSNISKNHRDDIYTFNQKVYVFNHLKEEVPYSKKVMYMCNNYNYDSKLDGLEREVAEELSKNIACSRERIEKSIMCSDICFDEYKGEYIAFNLDGDKGYLIYHLYIV